MARPLVIDADLLSRRVLALNDALGHLDRDDARSKAALAADPMLRAAVERWLQIAIEACIDMAFHVIAARGWTPPDGSRSAFNSLAGHGLLDAELAGRLGAAAGLRNVLVHNYTEIDLARIAAAIANDLDDLRRFAAAMATLIVAAP